VSGNGRIPVHVLVVYCHPSRESFCGAVLDRFTHGLAAAGHSFEVADLYNERFEPVFLESDFAQFEGGTMPPAILAEQARVDRCDALAFISPIWWLGLPAMLKGWFDRVWSNGWAYEFSNNPEGSLLPARPFVFLLTAGGSRSAYRTYRYDSALDAILRVGVLGWCGVSESTIAILHDTGFDDEASVRHLDYSEAFGRSVLSKGTRPAERADVSVIPAVGGRRRPDGHT
jgi:NAD(P)H dehydrogenase (quinone)